MDPPVEDLPLVDEHAVEVPADPAAAWAALQRSVVGSGGPAGRVTTAYARLVGCDDVDGRPVGFHVERAEAPSVLVLRGRHRFSTYALTFRVDDLGDGRSRVRAETRAAFPGSAGRAYRALTVSSGIHARAVRGMLRGVRVAAR